MGDAEADAQTGLALEQRPTHRDGAPRITLFRELRPEHRQRRVVLCPEHVARVLAHDFAQGRERGGGGRGGVGADRSQHRDQPELGFGFGGWLRSCGHGGQRGLERGHAPGPDLLAELARLDRRSCIQLPSEHRTAHLVLPERIARPSHVGKQPHQAAMRRLAQRIERHLPNRRGHRRLQLPGGALERQKPTEGVDSLLAERLPLRQDPIVEGVHTGAELFEQVATIGSHGTFDAGVVARIEQRYETLDVDRDAITGE